MARTRKSVTSYPAQLKRFLTACDPSATFSLATLENEFELRPHESQRAAINQIHRALLEAWQTGEIVAFVITDGADLIEQVDRSTAVERPDIFGLPEAAAPQEGYHACTYAEWEQRRAATNGEANGHGPAVAEVKSAPAGDSDGVELGGRQHEIEESTLESAAETQSSEQLNEISRDFRVSGPAPEWLPDRLLSHIVTLPAAISDWRSGLDRAQGADKLQLIRAGVRRRGDVDVVTARRLAALCRKDKEWWGRAFAAAVKQYHDWGDWVADEDLGGLRTAPDDFFLEHGDRYQPEAIVLCGITLDADAEALALVATEAANALEEEEGAQIVSVQEELRRRASSLEAEAAELCKQLEDKEDEAAGERQRAAELAAQLERLREAASAESAVGEQLADAERRNQDLVEENAALKTRVDRAERRADSVDELREQVAEIESDRAELSARLSTAENERGLREQVEARLQDQIAETRRLERERQDTNGVGGPVEDSGALLRALAKPVAEATKHAAHRLAAGQPLPDDARLLHFAGAFGELAVSATPSQPASPPAEPPVTPESVDSAPPPVDSELPTLVGTDEPAEAASELPPPDERAAEPATSRRRSRRTAAFTVHPFGGAGEVGGSAIVIQTRSGDTVLLDAGQRVKGEYGIDTQSPFHYSLPTFDQVDAIVISHAHIDHVGSLPVLYGEYERKRDQPLPIIMSEPTLRLGEIMMRDSAKIQHKRQYLTAGAFQELAQSDFAPELDIKPAYTDADITATLEAVEPLEARQPRVIPGTSLTVKLLPVAHVLGSCAVHLTDNNSGATLLYTGDLGPLTDTQRTLPDFDGVHGFDGADVVIMESTYGLANENEKEGRRGNTRDDALQTLYRAAQKAADAGGHVLLPAFALGRTQELLRVIEDATATGEMPAGDVYIGGMGEKISEIYSDYKGKTWVAPGEMRRASQMNRWLQGGTDFDEAVEEAVSRDTFSYLICSPAMLSGGWSRAFLSRMVEDERHAIVFTGYLPRHGGGIRNLSQLYTGAPITLGDSSVKIACDWRKAPLSAHAPHWDLRAFAQRMLLGGKQVNFGIVHGMPEAQASLAGDINDLEGATATPLSNGVPWKPHLG